jgi:two-component system, NtrC family, response regulator AtoC
MMRARDEPLAAASSGDSTTADSQPALGRPTQASVFVVFYYAGDAQAFELIENEPLVVGRQWPANAIIDDAHLSRQHARFTCVNGAVTVEDLNSRNGTHVGGAAATTAALRVGEQVAMGRVIASVHVSLPPSALPARLESYDSFGSRLNAALARARTRNAPLILIAVRGSGSRREHVRNWWPHLHEMLRTSDAIAVLDDDTLLVMQTALSHEEGVRTADGIAANRFAGWSLLCGVATFPLSGSSAEELMAAVLQAARAAAPSHPVVVAQRPDRSPAASLVVESPRLKAVHDLARRIAQTSAPALILGETGSGKEVVAELVHRSGPRAARSYVTVNCGALPANLVESALFGHVKGAFTGAHRTTAGVFERADGGTVFLDEVADLSAATQTFLLRVLDTQRFTPVGGSREIAVDVRIVAATNRDIEAMVESGEFRRDLWYRLNTVILEVPPLRDRPEDVGPLARLFLEQASVRWVLPRKAIAVDAMTSLTRYCWPGNVRELRNVMERALLVSATAEIANEDLPERIRSFRGQREKNASIASAAPPAPTCPPAGEEAPLSRRVQEYEAELILRALNECGGNVTQAAVLLRMSTRSLSRKIARYKLSRRFTS